VKPITIKVCRREVEDSGMTLSQIALQKLKEAGVPMAQTDLRIFCRHGVLEEGRDNYSGDVFYHWTPPRP